MIKLAEQIKQMVETEAAEFGAFLVGQSSGEQGLYRYYVDAETALSLNTLADITRKVSRAIDESDLGDTPFVFEVSSPGADRPLIDLRQFAKHKGRNFEITTSDAEFEGKLLEVNGNVLSFEKTQKDKKGNKTQVAAEICTLPFEQIKSAIIKISFK